jgi:hypothetical protein
MQSTTPIASGRTIDAVERAKRLRFQAETLREQAEDIVAQSKRAIDRFKALRELQRVNLVYFILAKLRGEPC